MGIKQPQDLFAYNFILERDFERKIIQEEEGF